MRLTLSPLLLAASGFALVACGAPPAASFPTTTAPEEAPTPPRPGFICSDPYGCVDIAPDAPIHIAYALALSGAVGPLGEDARRAIDIAIDDAGGRVLGHPILLAGEDTLCNAEGGRAAATRLAADPTIVAIVGTTCSSEARAAMPVISGAGMTMISPSNVNPDLTDPDHPDQWVGYLRTAHNGDVEARLAAEWAFSEMGLTTAATLHDGSPEAERLAGLFAEYFTGLGGTITSQQAIEVGQTDMSPALLAIAADTPELLFYPVFEPEGGFVTEQARSTPGLQDLVLLGGTSLFTDSFPGNAGAAVAGVFLMGPRATGEDYEDFLASWREAYGEVPGSGSHAAAYDAVNMTLQAIESVAIVSEDGAVHIPRQGLRDALYRTSGFPGLTGTLTCDENGDCAAGDGLAVYRLTDAEAEEGHWPPEIVWSP
jgi:branched-chain amino acid transport system substrate-binding protein